MYLLKVGHFLPNHSVITLYKLTMSPQCHLPPSLYLHPQLSQNHLFKVDLCESEPTGGSYITCGCYTFSDPGRALLPVFVVSGFVLLYAIDLLEKIDWLSYRLSHIFTYLFAFS